MSVSVVIPSYNRADLIEPTVRSILAQTHPATEILIIDDGSTDNTAEVCARFPTPVRYIRQENRGLPGARNRGIEEATGEWIALCDSDDLWHPRKLEVQMAALGANPEARWSITECSIIDPDGRRVESSLSGFERVFPVFREQGVTPERHFARALEGRPLPQAGPESVVYVGDPYGLLFEGNFGLPSSAVVSAALMRAAGAFDEEFRYGEETEFFHRMAAASPAVIVMDALVEYRVGHASMISTWKATGFTEYALRSLDQAARLRPALTAAQSAAYRKGRRRLQMRLAYARLSSLDQAGARRALRESWSQAPELSREFVGIFFASLLPGAVLRGLHAAKQKLRVARG